MIRPAVAADVPRFAAIINSCAEHGQMLHRSLSDLYEHLRNFHIAEDDGRLIGVCGLSIVWGNLAEVYALAVTPDQRGKGVGRQLVEATIQDARHLGIRKLMTLTYEQPFFERLNFEVIDRQNLPLKVWSECLRCPKNQACDEIAMIRILQEVVQIDAPSPEAPAPGTYEVPILLGIRGRPPQSEPSPADTSQNSVGQKKPDSG